MKKTWSTARIETLDIAKTEKSHGNNGWDNLKPGGHGGNMGGGHGGNHGGGGWDCEDPVAS